MRRAIRLFPDHNLRQALFAAAGMSESEKYPCQRVFLWATDGTGKSFAACRSQAKHMSLPNKNYVLMATMRFGDVETTYYPDGAEREMWPDYPWLDSSIEAAADDMPVEPNDDN